MTLLMQDTQTVHQITLQPKVIHVNRPSGAENYLKKVEVKSNTSTENLHASYRLLFQSQQKTSTTRSPTWTWAQAPACGQVTPLLPLPPHSLNPLQMLPCFLLGNSLELLCEPAVFLLQMKRGELSQMAFFFVHFVVVVPRSNVCCLQWTTRSTTEELDHILYNLRRKLKCRTSQLYEDNISVVLNTLTKTAKFSVQINSLPSLLHLGSIRWSCWVLYRIRNFWHVLIVPETNNKLTLNYT